MRKVDDRPLWNGCRSEIWIDDKEIVTRDVMDVRTVQTLLDDNQNMRNHGGNRNAQGRIAARIPLPMFYEWQKEWKTKYRKDWTWETFLASRINNRDYSQLRTSNLRRI